MNNILSKIVLPVLLLVVLITFNELTFASTTGKISGVVKNSKTGEPLPGANVILVGTALGAAADIEGDYFILNVPSGVYNVKATMMGYEPMTFTNVRVSLDRSITVNFELKETAIETEGVIITAQRDIIKPDVSSSQHTIISEQITETPVSRVEDVIALQPGIRLQDDTENIGFSIRGSDVSEVGFNIDGISMVDNRTQTPYIGMSRSAIQEVQILTGGFNAEYGNIRSGMVNVVTKEGTDRFSGSIEYGYQVAQRKHFGPDVYDPKTNFYQTYAYGPEDKVFGAWSANESPIGRSWMGWNEYSRRTLEDSDPDNDITPQEALEIWKWYHRGYKYGENPDQILDASLGGPLFGNIKFFTSVWWEKSWLAYPLARDYYQNLALQLKLTYPITPNIKLSLRGMRGRENGNRAGWLDNGVIRNAEAAANQFWNPYNEGDMSALLDNYRDLISLKLSHLLSKATYYDLYVDYTKYKSWARPMALRDTVTTIKQIGDKWYDETPAGFIKNPEYPDDPLGYSMAVGTGDRDSSWYHGLDLKFDLTSQINKYNQVKTGVYLNINKFNELRAFVGPAWSIETAPQRLKYTQTTIEGAFYIQDKIEFEGMIANLGLRLEYNNPNTDWVDWDTDPFEEALSASNFDPDAGPNKTKPVRTKLYLSPRLGISHPVSDKSKIFFNYGHFYQKLQPWQMYRAHYTSNAKNALWLGNPNLEFPRTVAYELGFDYNIMNTFLLHIAGYYQDITNELDLYTVQDFDASVNYTTFKNDLYRDRRGIEFWLRREEGRFYTFWLNFDYQVISEGQSGNRYLFENPNLRERQRRLAGQSKPYPQPRLTLMLDLHTPYNWGLLKGGWRTILIYEWEAGDRWTYNPADKYGVSNNVQNVDWSNTNLRILKKIQMGMMNPVFYLEVQNLFNQKFLNTDHFHDDSEWLAYMNSLKGSWQKGAKKGNDKYGEYKQDYIQLGFKEYMRFLNPRSWKLGVKFEF